MLRPVVAIRGESRCCNKADRKIESVPETRRGNSPGFSFLALLLRMVKELGRPALSCAAGAKFAEPQGSMPCVAA